ncbi:helix-turn-helix domain-containing protein [Enterococcus sp. DIV0242_7C1]|uniref:Mga helix-turn-helix domain-containing protein n=1 Tax=Candidatus Enterococcus dunnyi TaxID=1834192 RepID=A0A200J8Q9_9ENTE|nr:MULTISPECIES: helix-turn-helix domain-containing protein [unclassified Enterococcus]MBO0469914.1 helix-turn-helix domain-containing protein [Enterococcus sp. DIV0242_7C1]OUZ32955.1 hypothetical protein A5889_001664 [Enterococcus sp. 9D6_DIV0238]
MEQNLIISLEENTELKLTLLAIMRENDTWLIGDELGEKLNVPTKRVHTLISSLLQDLMDFGSDQIQLTILKGRGSYLQIDDPKEYVRFRQHLIESSVTFQIILAIATNDGPTLGQLSVNHFVSESLIRKRIHNVNQMIKKNEVKIVSRKNHYQFQGEEAQIRFILNTILWHLYRGSEWTFDTIDQKKLFQILQEICKTVNLPIKSLTLYEIGYSFAINFTRARQGYAIGIKPKWKAYLFLCEEINRKTNIYQVFSDRYGLSREETIFFLLEILSRSKLYRSLEERTIVNQRNLNQTPAYMASERLLEKYEEVFGKLSEQKRQLFFDYTYPCHIYADLFTNIVYTSAGYLMYSQTNNYFPNLKSKVKKLLRNLYQETMLDLFLNKQYLADKYILIFSFFQPVIQYEKEHVIYVETDLSEMLEQKLVSQIKKNFDQFFNIKIYTKLKTLKKHRGKFDVIISTSASPTFKKYTDQAQYFLVHPVLTRRDIQMISDYLHLSLENAKKGESL